MSTNGTEGHSVAPWTPAEVATLNEYQQSGILHPFTCTCGGLLVATPEGWRCESCPDYRQKWAHRWMADGGWRQMRNDPHG